MVENLKALRDGLSIDFWGNEAPKCPHCGSDFDIYEGDAWHLYDEHERHELECQTCNKDFQVRSIVTWTFSTDEQDED